MAAPAPAHTWALVTETGARAALWRHVETGDTWEGDLSAAVPPVPLGEGKYVFASTGLQVTGIVHGDMQHLVFNGNGVMQWPDGSRYVGNLKDSKFDGRGRFAWANGGTYDGAWHEGRRQGHGTFETHDAAFLALEAEGKNAFAHSMCYAGEWSNDLMEGDGVIQYFGAPEASEDALQDPWRNSNQRGPLLRRFTGVFKKGLPTVGELKTQDECFDKVAFHGATDAGCFATWYWAPSPAGYARGGVLVDLDARGEEYRAVCSRFTASMPSPDIRIAHIQRVQNDDLRCIYDVQRNALEKKVTRPPRSSTWNTHTMERFAFHAPVCFFSCRIPTPALAVACVSKDVFTSLPALTAARACRYRRRATRSRPCTWQILSAGTNLSARRRPGKASSRRAFRRLWQALGTARCTARAFTLPRTLLWRTSTRCTASARTKQAGLLAQAKASRKSPCACFSAASPPASTPVCTGAGVYMHRY